MRALLLLGFVCSCATDVTLPAPTPPPPPDPVVDPFGVMVEPRLGRVVTGDPAAATITVAGVAATPGYRIDVQIPNGGNWTTIASTFTDTTPSATDATMYEWNLTVAPAALDPARWSPGGMLRVRAVGESGDVLGAIFHDVDACLAKTDGWRARAVRCGTALTSGVPIVNATPVLLDASPRPRFLDQRGDITTTETAAYYQAIAAPTTLAAFRSVFGFAANEITTTYYNAADLGIGRGMHCAPQSNGGLACYVSNYGTFGGDAEDALSRAVTGEAAGGTGAFASVAMVYTPPIDAPNSVQFIVYNAVGSLATSATLDTFGDNTSIPTNCLNCHGAAATYDPNAHAVTNAHFLPFDAANLGFSSQPGLTATDQATNLARLNALVANAGATPAIARIANDPSLVPDGWNGSALERAVYRNVNQVACRGCHATLDGAMTLESAADFRAQSASIAAAICSTGRTMPDAEVPFERIWNGPARAYVAAYLELSGPCAP
jgi:hypothetical protein